MLNNKKRIDQLNLKNKKVIIRVDFNVPMKDGKITNNKRIVAAIPTIKKAYESGAKVILLSHLGRVKEESDKAKKSLKPVAAELTRLLGVKVKFVPFTSGPEVKTAVKEMQPGQIIMLENTRWEDLNNKAESKNNPKLGKFWASLGDVFINDAFGTAHRAHASNVGIASNISESAIGYLVADELDKISRAINNPPRPAIAIIGGAKVSDKIKTIENLVKNVDKVIIGGGMAFTFWKAQGLSIGNSLVEEDQIPLAKEYLKKYQDKLVLPIDAALSSKFENIKPIYNNENSLEIPKGYMGLDIGPKSIQLFKKEILGARTVIWNGPLGVCEFSYYSVGTEEIAKAIGSLTSAYTIVGGGDSVAAITSLGLESKFSHISTGGGACLAMLEGSPLPGVEAIQNENDAPKEVQAKTSTLDLKVDKKTEKTEKTEDKK
ncbi:MAG: phosphoglycerate kinase [Mycoplasma sp.]|nr:phosphoglycerate kinase [Mycoplasma sp.]